MIVMSASAAAADDRARTREGMALSIDVDDGLPRHASLDAELEFTRTVPVETFSSDSMAIVRGPAKLYPCADACCVQQGVQFIGRATSAESVHAIVVVCAQAHDVAVGRDDAVAADDCRA